MMPSRGLHALRGIAPRSSMQIRNFSITRAAHSRSHLRLATAATSIIRPSLRITSAIAATSQFSRNASTTSSFAAAHPPSPTLPPPPPTAPSTSSLPNIDTLTLDDIDFSASSFPAAEGLGYLKEIGIDYGWGPTSVVQWTLEHWHIWGGLPWWGAIAATAITFRVLTFPLFVRSQRMIARTQALTSIFKPLQERQSELYAKGDTTAASLVMRDMFVARKEAGLKYSTMFIPPVVQGVIGFCGFRLMNGMTRLPVPGLKDGGFLWLTDLTIPDGYLILPALMAVMVHMAIRLGGENGDAAMGMAPGWQAIMLWGVPPILFLIVGFQSATLGVWFIASTIMGLLQAALFRSKSVRRLMAVPPLYRPADTTAMALDPAIIKPKYQAPSSRRGTSKVIDTTLAQQVPSAAAATTTDKPSPWKDIKKKFHESAETRLQNRQKKVKEQAIREAFEKRRRQQ